ncbi:MAG: hypothetical protein IKS07_05165, partial [Lachnospiraceae bacterium]|nr:hypothetical protein [Lachnospiraceae bacterium]
IDTYASQFTDEDLYSALDGAEGIEHNLKGKLDDGFKFAHISEEEYLLSRPDAQDRIRQEYLEQMKEEPIFRQILREGDPDRIFSMLEELQTQIASKGGLTSFSMEDHFRDLQEEFRTVREQSQKEMDKLTDEVRKELGDAVDRMKELTDAGKELETSLAELQASPLTDPDDPSSAMAGLQREVKAFLDLCQYSSTTPRYDSPKVREQMRRVAEAAEKYIDDVREKAGAVDADWEPAGAVDKKQFLGAKQIVGTMRGRLEALEKADRLKEQGPEKQEAKEKPLEKSQEKTRKVAFRGEVMTSEERLRIETSKEIFRRIPTVNLDKALESMLKQEEQYRREHASDQEATMVSAIRTMTVLAAIRRFPPEPGESAADRTRRHQAMKEALSPERIQSNLLKLYVDMSHEFVEVIDGVTVNGRQVVNAAIFRMEDMGGEGATTKQLAGEFTRQLQEVLPWKATQSERSGFYAVSESFEKSFLEGKEPLSEESRKAFAGVQEAFQRLNALTEPLYTADEQGRYPLCTEEDYRKILEGYQQVLGALGEFSRQVADSGHPLDAKRAEMIGNLERIMGEDVIALNAGKQMGLTTLPDMLLNGKVPTVELEGTAATVGSQANTRFRIDLPGNGGEKLPGFFTPTSRVTEDLDAYFQEVLDRETAGHPEWKSFIQKIFAADADPATGVRMLNSLTASKSIEERMAVNADLAAIPDSYVDDYSFALDVEEYEAIRSPEFGMAFYRITQDYGLKVALNELYAEQGLEKGNLDKRNSAMSTVAELLGVGSVIAPSKSVKVKMGDQVVSGTFMGFANGFDLANLSADHPLLKVSAEDMATPEAIASVADLQVLDFVCGNVDRHSLNMFYQFDMSDPEHPKFTGVQGIDNDFSFCAYADGKFMSGIKEMKIIREETAEKLFNLKPEMLRAVLRGYDLSDEEIEGAQRRVDQLKKAVESGDIRVVKDEELPELNYATELVGNTKNYFERMIAAPKIAQKLNGAKGREAADAAYGKIRDHALPMGKAYTEIVDANRGRFIGSRQYRDVKNGMEALLEERNELLFGRDSQKIELYEEKLREMMAKMDTYLEKKAREAEAKTPSELAVRRTEAVSRMKELIAKELDNVREYKAAAEALRSLGDAEERENEKAMQKYNDFFAKGKLSEFLGKLEKREGEALKASGDLLLREGRALLETFGKEMTDEIREQRKKFAAAVLLDELFQDELKAKKGEELEISREIRRDPGTLETLRRNLMASPAFSEALEKVQEESINWLT